MPPCLLNVVPILYPIYCWGFFKYAWLLNMLNVSVSNFEVRHKDSNDSPKYCYTAILCGIRYNFKLFLCTKAYWQLVANKMIGHLCYHGYQKHVLFWGLRELCFHASCLWKRCSFSVLYGVMNQLSFLLRLHKKLNVSLSCFLKIDVSGTFLFFTHNTNKYICAHIEKDI